MRVTASKPATPPSATLARGDLDLDQLLRMIDAGAENARAGLPARIVGKMNAVTELQTMRALYRASQAGVQIDLVERITSIPDATLPDSDGYYEVG